MAPLYTTRHKYIEAVQCYRKAIDFENDNLLKVQILTKITGNLKKCNDKEGTIKAGKEAYKLCEEEVG